MDFDSPQFWIAVVQIIAIDIVLGGDNAVEIALACRRLPEQQRKLGIFWGVFGAITLRVVLIFFALSLLALVTMLSSTALAQKPVTVGGAPMFPNKNIIENAVNSKDHTTLVAAVKAAGLVETLQGNGPFTVFAPVNAAFDALPAGSVDALLKPENKGTLTAVLTYHVIAARLNSKALERMIKQGNGRAILKTVQGGELTATMSGSDINITDAKGNTARITITNVNQSNGVIHVVDRVLLPQ